MRYSVMPLAGNFGLQSMFSVLRDEKSGICMSDGFFVSTSSQVDLMHPLSHLSQATQAGFNLHSCFHFV